MKTFACSSLVPDCNAVLTAETDEKLIEQASIHAREVHGMAALPQEMIGRIRQLIVNRSPEDAAYVVDRIFETYNCDREPECTWRYISEAEMILTGQPKVHDKEIKAA